MAAAQGKRIQANCAIIWGNGDYDIDIETDDWVNYCAVVKKDFGTSFGPPLTMTGLCDSKEHAWNELDRMLRAWAAQVQSGEPMTRNQKLEIFGGPGGRNQPILKRFLDELDRRGSGGDTNHGTENQRS